MEKHYPLREALYAIGVRGEQKQDTFILLHQNDLTPQMLEYGITISQLVEIIEKMTDEEHKLYGIEKYKVFNNTLS